MTGVLGVVDACVRELALFAGAMLLVGGIDDLAVDLLWLTRRLRHGRQPTPRIEPPTPPGRIAVFIAAWHEADVIGEMLACALSRFRHGDYRIYVGTYPNDPATIEAVAAVAERDARIRLVIGPRPGPTTKADNLNALWHALVQTDEREGRRTRAVAIHDAEDLVHPDELGLYDATIGVAHVVQLPVLPLVNRDAALVSGHYADEFAESHGKNLVVRMALRAGLPLAGTGCAIAVPMLERIAASRGGDPFDAASLTEDYELGLRIAEMGGHGAFVRATGAEGSLIAVRAYFPGTLLAAARQKARWLTGIALAGWDRTGWSPGWTPGDHWMRMRDRRAPLAVIVLAAAYLSLVGWAVAAGCHLLAGDGMPPSPFPGLLLAGTTALLVWRLAMRVGFTAASYGWREGLIALPRFLVGNVVALMAAPRALGLYLGLIAGRKPRWDKTQHEFPADAARARTEAIG